MLAKERGDLTDRFALARSRVDPIEAFVHRHAAALEFERKFYQERRRIIVQGDGADGFGGCCDGEMILPSERPGDLGGGLQHASHFAQHHIFFRVSDDHRNPAVGRGRRVAAYEQRHDTGKRDAPENNCQDADSDSHVFERDPPGWLRAERLDLAVRDSE